MTPVSVIPGAEPLPLPAPAGVLWALLMLTLVLHILAMNLFVGGSVLAAVARVRHRGDEHARAWLLRFAKAAPVIAAATISFGVAPLLFLQTLYGRLFFTSSVLMAWAWVAIVPALIVAYYATYAVSHRAQAKRLGSPRLYGVIVVLVLAIGFLYTTNMTLMLAADRFSAMYQASGRGLHLNFAEPTLWPRWLHMIVGAVSVAGLALAVAGARSAARGSADGRWAQRFGTRASITATSINMVIGLWWLDRLPSDALTRLMGGSPVATTLFVVGVVAGFGTLIMLLLLARPGASTRLGFSAVAGMLVTVVAMLLVRDQVRAAALERLGGAPTSWVVMQWGPFLLFAVLLVAALAVVGWMAAVFLRSPAPKEEAAPVVF